MLRLILAAVLASACLAFPQKRDGPDAADLKSFGPDLQGMQVNPAMPNLQGIQAMPANIGAGQFLPFNPNFATGYKRAADENLEKRHKHHSKFTEGNASPFDVSADSTLGKFDFGKFMQENADNLPFANMDNANAGDLGNFENPAEGSKEGHFRFFDKQQ